MIVGVRKLHFFAQPVRLMRFLKLQKVASKKQESPSKNTRSFFSSWEQMHTEQTNLILKQMVK